MLWYCLTFPCGVSTWSIKHITFANQTCTSGIDYLFTHPYKLLTCACFHHSFNPQRCANLVLGLSALEVRACSLQQPISRLVDIPETSFNPQRALRLVATPYLHMDTLSFYHGHAKAEIYSLCMMSVQVVDSSRHTLYNPRWGKR